MNRILLTKNEMISILRKIVALSCCLVLLSALCGCDNQTAQQAPANPEISENPPAQQIPQQSTQLPTQKPANSNNQSPSNNNEPKSNIRFEQLPQNPKSQYQNHQQANHHTMLETIGGGVALFDYDNDGLIDMLFTGGGHFSNQGADLAAADANQQPQPTAIHGYPPVLYRNNGDATFTDVTAYAGLNVHTFYSHGAFTADYDNDGCLDILITGFGGLLLFHNNGDGTFEEVASELNLNDQAWSVGAAWGDINNDGIVELYVAHYIDWSFDNHPFCAGKNTSFLSNQNDTNRRDTCSPRIFAPLPDQLFQFDDNGRFVDISQQAGIRSTNNKQYGKGLGVLMADLDLDGDLDIYVTNDTVANFFWRNRGDGAFEEVAALTGVGFDNSGNADGSMGIDLGDYNLDGLPDLFVTNFQSEQFALYKNLGNALFQHVSSATGMLSFPSSYVGWGTAFVDADNDGDEDLFVANGHVQRYPVDSSITQLPIALENKNGRFAKVNHSLGSYFTSEHNGRGIATGDLNNDGYVDLAYTHVNQNCSVLINHTDNNNQWITLQLIGTKCNRSAIGTRVTLTTNTGKQVRQIKGGSSFASSNDSRIFFGIAANAQISQLEVHWAGGETQIINSPAPNQQLTIIQP
ncbi:MAG TPA: CRTAC1 family protein [Planctomycetes bacterium]|nr:CRTAC1 family protein [Planctomycetota bacterium]